MSGTRRPRALALVVAALLLVGSAAEPEVTGFVEVQLDPVVQGLDRDRRLVVAVDRDESLHLARSDELLAEVAAPFDDLTVETLRRDLRVTPTDERTVRIEVEAPGRARAAALALRAGDALLALQEEAALARLRQLGEGAVTSLQAVQAERQTLEARRAGDDGALADLRAREARLRRLLARLRRQPVEAGRVLEAGTTPVAGPVAGLDPVDEDAQRVELAAVDDGVGEGGAAWGRVVLLSVVLGCGAVLFVGTGRPPSTASAADETRTIRRVRAAIAVAIAVGLGVLSVVDALLAAAAVGALLVLWLIRVGRPTPGRDHRRAR